MTDFQDVSVRLSGEDGNAFAIIGRCRQAARRAKKPADQISAFQAEATRGDYDNVLATCLKWFDVN
jgi:hypothetical protein